MMKKLSLCSAAVINVALLLSTLFSSASAFVTPRPIHQLLLLSQKQTINRIILQADNNNNNNEKKEERQTLGLLTFDLDDTLYPIAIVEEEANQAFVKAMAQYGFADSELTPRRIVEVAQTIRDEVAATDGPQAASAMTHSELRLAAIRREMERLTAERKLKACAEEWATSVDALSPLVYENAKKWAKQAVDDNVVRAVSTAWEMERHHSAERNLYPEVLDALTQIKQEHPTAIIGAVTDGRSDPKFMTFTLAPMFDFRCSWEDDQAQFQRKEFFQKLESARGITDLQWIYEDARYNYSVLKKAADGMMKNGKPNMNGDDDDNNNKSEPLIFPATYDDRVWIHVGDDLAFDVGGSAACGAKTIYTELDDERYHQTARYRYTNFMKDKNNNKNNAAGDASSWSTTPQEELKARYKMAKEAESKVSVKLRFLSQLPDAINDILTEG